MENPRLFGFGTALLNLKLYGKKVAREGWNWKGMYLYFVPSDEYNATTDIARKDFGDIVPYQSYIAIKPVNDGVVPWVASQPDLLSEDWYIVD